MNEVQDTSVFSTSGNSNTSTTNNIQLLEQFYLQMKNDIGLAVPEPDIPEDKYQAALAVVAEAVAAEMDLPEKKPGIQDAVGRILRAALDAVDPTVETGDADSGGFVLFKECHFPAVNQPPKKEGLRGTLKSPFYFPFAGIADFGFGLAQSGTTRSAYRIASYTVYSMMRVLPYLSDDEKRLIFGDNIVMYGLLLTHKTARLINVSPLNFCLGGKFTVCCGELQSTNGTVMNDPFVKLITGFTFESVRILRHLRKLINRFSAPPLYCWLPVEAYKTIIKERNGPVTYHQTFTNPIIKVGETYYRIYRSAFSKTLTTNIAELLLDAAFAKQRNSEFVNPFEGWIFARPFMAVPDYGLSLHDVLHSNRKVTLKMIQNLIQSLAEKSMVPLTTVQYCHMDIRPGNICVKDLEGWTDARLIDYDFAAKTKGTDLNPMDKSNIQYPKEE
ncbi:hypothetical protein BCR33DRAFT_719520, partial [Rhizoclosmatium globosum]